MGASADAGLRRTLERLWAEVAMELPGGQVAGVRTAELSLSTATGPVRLGLDLAGDRHLLVPLPVGSTPRDDRRSAGVHLTSRMLLLDDTPALFADLHCRRRDLYGVFTGLTADICERLAAQEAEAFVGISGVLNSWRSLFDRTNASWTESRLAGLYAELTVLERLLAAEPSAAAAWKGPFEAAQDFCSAHHAVEVKATTLPNGRMVTIHGSDQLERPPAGLLALVWFRLAVTRHDRRDSVPAIIARCLDLCNDPAVMTAALDRLQLPDPSEDATPQVGFEVLEERWYEVDGAFPRITPERFINHVLPAGVGRVEYTVDLDTAVPSASSGESYLRRLQGDL